MVGRAIQVSVQSDSPDDLLAPGSFDRCDEVLVVPGIHSRTVQSAPGSETLPLLGPNIPAEAFRLHRSEHDRDVEYLGSLRECHGVVNDRLTIEVADSEQHLRLWSISATTQLSGVRSPSR